MRPLKGSGGQAGAGPVAGPGPGPSRADRPKWGVNRPDTQYRTQSEKDPYYQQRLQRLRRLHQRMLRHLRSSGSNISCGSCSHGTVNFSELDQFASRCV